MPIPTDMASNNILFPPFQFLQLATNQHHFLSTHAPKITFVTAHFYSSILRDFSHCGSFSEPEYYPHIQVYPYDPVLIFLYSFCMADVRLVNI